jgi:hypothetical protein
MYYVMFSVVPAVSLTSHQPSSLAGITLALALVQLWSDTICRYYLFVCWFSSTMLAYQKISFLDSLEVPAKFV